MSDTPIIRPYQEARHFDQDAWFLYETTSLPYYTQCAQLCEDFAHFFNRLLTGHSAHGRPKVDYWVSRYLNHAENIRRGIHLIELGGDYMPMLGFLRTPDSDWRGLIENAFGYESKDEWKTEFDRLGYACGVGAETLANNEWAGSNWLNHRDDKNEKELVDRDNSHHGDLGQTIRYGIARNVLNPAERFPKFIVDRTLSAKPGQPCPRTGVWVPAQGIKEFSLAFCIEGRPMQPAYRITHCEVHNIYGDDEPELAAEYLETATGTPVTRAEDTTWYFVERDETILHASSGAADYRGRCEAGQPCPRAGFWFTPAKPDSRRRFTQGEVMPATFSDYGTTIWQWDENQQG